MSSTFAVAGEEKDLVSPLIIAGFVATFTGQIVTKYSIEKAAAQSRGDALISGRNLTAVTGISTDA